MRNTLTLIISITTCVLAFAQNSDQREIEKVADKFSKAYMEGDYATMISIYTDDAVLMPPGQDIIYGREAIHKFWTRDTTYHQIFHKSKSDKLEVVGDLAFDNGYWYSEAEYGGRKHDLASGKYLIIWKKNNKGEWQMYHDIWNNRARGWEEREKVKN